MSRFWGYLVRFGVCTLFQVFVAAMGATCDATVLPRAFRCVLDRVLFVADVAKQRDFDVLWCVEGSTVIGHRCYYK